MDRGPSQAARDLLADEIAAQGPAWANAASSIQGGSYANVWITAALAAIDLALDIDREELED